MTAGTSTTGLNSNIAGVLTYLFGSIGGILFLVIEREDRYVRFHAMQSTLTFLAALIVTLILGSLPVLGRPLAWLTTCATFVLWVVLMFKAFTGQRYKLPYVGEIAERQLS